MGARGRRRCTIAGSIPRGGSRSTRAAASALPALAVLGALLGAGGCTSTEEQVSFLEQLYREDGSYRNTVTRDYGFLDHIAAGIGLREPLDEGGAIEAVESPPSASREAILDILDAHFESPVLAARAIWILSRVAEKSPSPLNRSAALAAMTRIGRDHIPMVMLPAPAEDSSEVATQLVEDIIRVHTYVPSWDFSPEVENARAIGLAAVKQLSALGFSSTSQARAVTRLLTTIATHHIDPAMQELASQGAVAVASQTLTLTTHAALEDPDESIRSEAARIVGRRHDTSALPRLFTMLETESTVEVRRVIARSIGTMGDPAAVERLVGLLEQEKDESVMLVTAAALRRLTSQPLGSPEEWRTWWDTHGQDFRAGRSQ